MCPGKAVRVPVNDGGRECGQAICGGLEYFRISGCQDPDHTVLMCAHQPPGTVQRYNGKWIGRGHCIGITRCLGTRAAEASKGVNRLVDSFFRWTAFCFIVAAIKLIFQTSSVCHDEDNRHLRVISHDIDSMPIQSNVCPRHRFITGLSTGG
jgi:hypothetical protein